MWRLIANLLDLDLGPCCFELLLDVLSLVFADAFLHRLGGAFDQVLGFLETEVRHLADRLDDLNLVRAAVGENDVELGLLLGRSGAGGSATARGNARYGDWSRADAPLRLELLHELGDLNDGE